MIEKGDRVPSGRTIADICREFDVNEDWLRTGAGPMLVEKARDEELAELFGKVLTGMEVVDAICKVQTDRNDRPTIEQKMKSVRVDTKGETYPEPKKLKDPYGRS